MYLLELTPEQMKIAKDGISARFLNNSVRSLDLVGWVEERNPTFGKTTG
jgi:hypothetical protein